MKKIFIISILNLFSILNATTLQELYDNAVSGEGYQKLIILEKDSVYTGGFTQGVQSLCIHGNGAIIDLIGSSIMVDGEDYILDIDHCVIKSSSDTAQVFLEYKNNSAGKIINNTFWGLYNNNANLAIFFEECIEDTSIITNNIFSNFFKSLYFYTLNPNASSGGIPLKIEHNLHWQCETPYQYWGGWTGFPVPFIPIPGNGEKIDNPGFIMTIENNFGLDEGSVCIDNGVETKYEYHGNAPDIGALESSYSIFRGTKLSGYIIEDLVKSNSPYIIVDDVTISAENKILVSPGVEIRINYSTSVIVHGELKISGSIDDSVMITNNSYYSVPWGQILFEKNSSIYSTIKHTKIKNGSGIWKEHGSITCLNDSISISNCYFNNNQYTIYCGENSKVRISDNIFFEKPQFIGKRVIICAPLSKPYINNNILYSSSIYADSANPIIINNKFMGQNYRLDQQYWLIILANKSTTYLESNFFKDNYGAILVKDSSSLYSVNNLIQGCDEAILFSNSSNGSVINNTIYSKGQGPFSFQEGYGITCSNFSKIFIYNSIVWNIGEWSQALRVFNSSEIVAEYCALSTEFEGEEIIYDDPSFSNPDGGDFHLEFGSPCIDSGNPDTSNINLPLTDFDGEARMVNGRIDMGCFEYQYPNNITESKNIIAYNFTLKQNYPNPFNSVTIISFTIPKRSHVLLDIYDISGRKVKTLVDGYKAKDIYSLRFNAGGLSSGIYFYRLKIGNSFQQIKRMIYIQ